MSITVAFSLAEEDRSRLDRLSKSLANGNRSALFRIALEQLDRVDRAQNLRELQSYGVERSAAIGQGNTPVEQIVDRILGRHSE